MEISDMAHLGKIIVWDRVDGLTSTTYVDDRDRLPGETDDELIERIAKKHGQSEILQGAVRRVVAL